MKIIHIEVNKKKGEGKKNNIVPQRAHARARGEFQVNLKKEKNAIVENVNLSSLFEKRPVIEKRCSTILHLQNSPIHQQSQYL